MRANANRFHYRPDFIRAAQHDYIQTAIQLHQLLERVQTVHFRHQNVEDNEIRRLTRFPPIFSRDAPGLTASQLPVPIPSRSYCGRHAQSPRKSPDDAQREFQDHYPLPKLLRYWAVASETAVAPVWEQPRPLAFPKNGDQHEGLPCHPRGYA